jgi:hypothetical protein
VAVDEHGFSRFERLVRKENNGVYVFDLLGGKDLTKCRTVAPVLPPSTVGGPAVTHLRGKRPTLRGIYSSRIVFRRSKNVLFLLFNSAPWVRDCLPNAWWLSNA